MSFLGSVGKLIESSRLAKVMISSFSGVEKMLVWKKCPMNVSALRFVVIDL